MKEEESTVEESFECLSRTLLERERMEEEQVWERIQGDIKQLDELERSVLRRTVLVLDVTGMKNPSNRNQLKKFLQKSFGKIESCEVTTFLNEVETNQMHATLNPPARVRFRNRKDAEKIFRKGSLLGLIAQRRFKHHLGSFKDKHGNMCFKVVPSYRYPGMLDGELKRKVVTMRASKMSLGHWLSPERDAYLSVYPDTNVDRSSFWVEEFTTDVKPHFKIDIRNLKVELKVPRNHDNEGNFSFNDISDFVSFPFRSLIQKMELCHFRKTDEYAIAMSLKHPPRLETQKDPISGVGWMFYTDEKQRAIRFDTVPVDHFGKSTAILLYFSRDDLEERLLRSPALHSVKNCGLLRDDLVSLSQAVVTRVHYVANQQKKDVEQSLVWIHKRFPKIGMFPGAVLPTFSFRISHKLEQGFLLRSILDNGRTTYHHIYNDEVKDMNLLGFIINHHAKDKATFEASICQSLEAMCQSFTRYPFRLLLRVIEARQRSGFRLEDALGTLTDISTDAFFPIPRLLMSPSRIAVQKFENEQGNCVVRKFCQEEGFAEEAFLRVHIGDEDGQRLFYRDLVLELEEKLKRKVLAGIFINDTKYEFLAFSSSQLKEGAFWMCAVPEGWTVSKIVDKLGNFSSCKSVPKFASRIGLRFSTTYQSLPSHSMSDRGLVYTEISDIESQYKGRRMLHSDGNGMIRRIAANEVLQCIPSSPNLYDVSILQIRAGGSKGTVLIVDEPEKYIAEGEDPNADVFIRESMTKFKAPYSYLEVCCIGKHAPYYLNRNVILLLVKQGVAEEVFQQMQDDFLNDLDQMLIDPLKSKQLLSRLVSKDARIQGILLTMLDIGLLPSKEPFLFSCLHAARSHCHFGLRKKSRILVPKGAVLMGAIDVTGLLPEGCIFVQVRQEGPESSFKPLDGPCMVTKHPVMHPGDVRMLLAVDIPELRSFRNVILFSQHGKRPEADKMSGSDLDGDEFAVTWDDRLFLKGSPTTLPGENIAADAKTLGRANRIPLDYHVNPKTPAKEASFDIKNEDAIDTLLDHFFEYIAKDKLGWIGMLWQDYAAKFGADCNQCIELAKQHSIAVDYAKTGVPATVPERIVLPSLHPRAHWREKKGAPSFDDNKSIIGKLYNKMIDRSKQDILKKCKQAVAGRKIDRAGEVLGILDSSVPNAAESLRSAIDKSLVKSFDPEVPESLRISILSFARTQRRSFDSKIVAIMNEHGIRSEGEIFTGCIRKYHNMNQRRQFETSQDVLRKSGNLCDEYRSNFFRKVLDLHLGLSGAGVTSETRVSVEANKELEHVKNVVMSDSSDDDRYGLSKIAKSMAAAYYIVTYDPQSRWNGDPDRGQILFGFPWIVADILRKNQSTNLQQ